jgi:glycosyltransferase involved in cell wall biosynthesis
VNVLITHERFAPDFGGGGEYVVLETARGLMKLGVSVRVLTTGPSKDREYEGIPTIRLPVSRYRFNGAVREVAKLAREADLIQTFTYHAAFPSLLAGRWTRKPVVCLILGLFQEAWKDMRQGPGGMLRIQWEKYLLRRNFSQFVFISPYSRELGVRLGAPANRSTVNCPGIDLDQYAPARPKEDVVLFVGKYDVRKGIPEILDAARRLPEVRFELFGWGDNVDALKKAATSNVQFVNFERGAPLARAFSRARICLLPSRAETFGIALIEAMASGCAIISTIPLEFEGVHLHPGDQDGLVNAVKTLWNDPCATARMGESNVELAKGYTWDRFSQNLLNTYDDVLGQR